MTFCLPVNSPSEKQLIWAPVSKTNSSPLTLLLCSFVRNSNGVPGSIWPSACLIIQKMSETKKILTSSVNISLLTPFTCIYTHTHTHTHTHSDCVWLGRNMSHSCKEKNSLTFLTPFYLQFDCWVKLTRTVSMWYKHAGGGCKYVRWTIFILYVDYTN